MPDDDSSEIEALKSEVSELESQLSELNDVVNEKKKKGKKEIASWKFKLSNGLDSISIVRKKSKILFIISVRAVGRDMEAH